MDYYLYVICSENSQYVGTTSNLRDRLKRHNAAQNRSTKHKKDWKLVYFEKYDTLSEARRRERAVKDGKKFALRGVAQSG